MATLEKPITTQEELDSLIGERLKRERETAAKRYEGYISPDDLKKIQDTHAAEIKSLQDAADKVKAVIEEKDKLIAEGNKYRTDLEKTRIAINAGLKAEYASRLQGENAEQWKQDAEMLAKDFASARGGAPLGSPEPVPTDSKDVAAKKFTEWFDTNFN